MWKKTLLPVLIFYTTVLSVQARTVTDIRVDDNQTAVLKTFSFIDGDVQRDSESLPENTLLEFKVTSDKKNRYTRFHQYYQGVRVLGRSVVRHEPIDASSEKEIFFTGKLTQGLNLDIPAYYLYDEYRDKIVQRAIEDYKEGHSVDTLSVYDEDTVPVIWVDEDNKATFAYKASFRTKSGNKAETWPHYLIDAGTLNVIEQWNNVQSLDQEAGPGGNQKTGKYFFGQAGIPGLPVTKLNNKCFLQNSRLKVVSLNNTWNLKNPDNPSPVSYSCEKNTGDYMNGGWSPANDAFFFGNLVIEMYKKWYGQPLLKNIDGTEKKLTVLVHAGSNYENAYWDGSYLVFGDGFKSYHPMVSLGVSSHEMGHAFTGNNSNLLYFNQSGAINEAFSDMSAIAAEYYFMKKHPEAYQLIYGKSSLDWLIGDRIAKGNYALRSMSTPHLFGSADCLTYGPGCHKTWDDIVRQAQQLSANKRQSYIVHKGSGIFNKAFNHMVETFDNDVEIVFKLMLKANMTRWTASADFAEAACGVKQVAADLGYDQKKVQDAFALVNIIPDC